MKRWVIFGLLLVAALVLAGGWALRRNAKVKSEPHISSTGGRAMSVTLPELGRTYLQKDPQWGEELLGQTKETLGSVGCTVCSVAMAATSLGFPVNPSELNQKLRGANGFTGDGWLIWSTLSKVSDQKIEVIVTSRPTHAEIDDALARGEFPVVKFYLPLGIPHWVIVVGKDGLDYLIRDPAKHSAQPMKLSSRTQAIYSARFVRRKVVE